MGAGMRRQISRSAGQSGYTLLELLVALAIMSLLIVFVPRLSPSTRNGLAAKSATYQLAKDLRAARAEALTAGTETSVIIDCASSSYRIAPQGLSRSLGGGVSIAFRGPVDQSMDKIVSIHFFPDGSSTGGILKVTTPAGAARAIVVHTLSGRVSVDE